MKAFERRAQVPVLPEFRVKQQRAGRPLPVDLVKRNRARRITRAIGRRNQVKL